MGEVVGLPADAGPPVKLVYTVEETAALLGLSRGLAYELVRAGTIPAERAGRRWIVPRARLDAWLAGLDRGA
jgi:excisionase family DNA binding protein